MTQAAADLPCISTHPDPIAEPSFRTRTTAWAPAPVTLASDDRPAVSPARPDRRIPPWNQPTGARGSARARREGRAEGAAPWPARRHQHPTPLQGQRTNRGNQAATPRSSSPKSLTAGSKRRCPRAARRRAVGRSDGLPRSCATRTAAALPRLPSRPAACTRPGARQGPAPTASPPTSKQRVLAPQPTIDQLGRNEQGVLRPDRVAQLSRRCIGGSSDEEQLARAVMHGEM